MNVTKSEANQDSRRRFAIELLIKHPSIHPDEISSQLNLSARNSHCVGDPRVAPNGNPMGGVWPDTRWRHSVHHECWDQWWVKELASLIDQLEPHKSFFVRLRETGGSAQVIVQFLGDGYFGDKISSHLLARMSSLLLDFGIESFDVPQNERNT